MPARFVVRKNRYFDSVFLMQVAQRLQNEHAVEQAAALMGSDNNRHILATMGFSGTEIDAANPDDLIVALRGSEVAALEQILEHLDEWLVRPPGRVSGRALRTLEQGLTQQPLSNLAVISIPGEYAGKEAHKALESGLNVFLFSSNVPLEEEISLKQAAREKGLIVMGADCGTSIIAGIGVGFANVVRRGSIGVVGASGTGLQEFTSIVHRCGSGISHAIGTGSRDLSDEVGGITTLQALDALEADPGTAVIGIVSKPPAPATLARLIERAGRSVKPVVACFVGIETMPEHAAHVHILPTLDDAAGRAVSLAGGAVSPLQEVPPDQWQAWLVQERARLLPEQKYIRGIFAGGTFCYQAQQVIGSMGLAMHSNAPIHGMHLLDDPARSVEHTLVDMGSEFFTGGRPHPMIDSSLRRERILAEAHDANTALLLLDFVLGYNASPDPVGDLIGAIQEARAIVAARGGYLPVIASVCGTDADFQNLAAQTQMLKDAGVMVLPGASKAARFSGQLIADSGGSDGQ